MGRRAAWRIPLAGLLVLLALAAALARADVPGPGPRRFTLVHLNDFYRIEGVEGRRRGGIARLGAALDRLRAQGPLLTLFAGDLLSPSLMSREFEGAQMIEAMNAVAPDAATFGNHEFDSGDPGLLLARLAESRFL